ncbi:MAG: tetraacyldisaccharide 4'-kinase [Bacteroidales bacterium]|nr:tetraacyldisaccharide 4'-kinase [Bacteroidales bacterium]
MRTIQLVIAILFFPVTIWYAVGVAFRNLSYRLKIRKSTQPEIPTIGIGNLRVGGTGKTPHTEYLIRLFERGKELSTFNFQLSTYLLSRGYGRKTKGFLLADESSTAADIGDEPLMMHRKFPDLTVAVCEDRLEGLHQIKHLTLNTNSLTLNSIVLLDDCYQHRRVKPGLTILLTEYSDLYVDDHILPFGNLREFRSGSRHADIIVVTKCPPLLSKQKRQKIINKLHPTTQAFKHSKTQTIYFSYIDYSSPLPLFTKHSTLNTNHLTLLLVSGIANPEPLKRHLERHSTVTHLSFPDHHKFSRLDCELIVKKFNNIKADNKAIVTTEKDAMRFIDSPHRHLFDDIPFFYVPIEVKFFDQNDFDTTILDFFHNFAKSKQQQ